MWIGSASVRRQIREGTASSDIPAHSQDAAISLDPTAAGLRAQFRTCRGSSVPVGRLWMLAKANMSRFTTPEVATLAPPVPGDSWGMLALVLRRRLPIASGSEPA
jgi:hypothetical protein